LARDESPQDESTEGEADIGKGEEIGEFNNANG